MHCFRFDRFCPCRVVSSGRLGRCFGGLTLFAAISASSLVWGQQQQPAPAPAAPAVTPAIPTVGQAPEAMALDKKLLTGAKTGSQIITNLTYLSDEIGPRLTGSGALKRANEWTAEKMKSYGLSNVHLEGWTIPVGWERGTANARLVEPNNGRTLTLAAAGWSPSTKGKIEGDVVVLNARTTADLANYKGKLNNAIVLRSPPSSLSDTGFPTGQRGQRGQRGQPPGQNPPGQPPQPPGQNPPAQQQQQQAQNPPGQPGQPGQNPRRGRGFGEMGALQREMTEFLRTEGAAAVLQDAGKPQGLLNMTGGWRRGGDRTTAGEPIPSVFMVHEHYAMLYRLATRPGPARTRLEIEITNKLIPGPIAVYNTVGEIPGKEKPDEYVILGAHLDSWDLGTGTTDNGTGSMIVLEAARLLANCGVQPRRTIRFVLFTGEEQGLYGSRAYVQQHKDELPRISMCLVHDWGTGRVTTFATQGREILKPVFEAELVSLKEIGVTEVTTRSSGGSDHQSFDQAGVPGFACQQDQTGYNFTHHSQSDTLDKAREADLIQGAQVMAVTAMRIANLPTLLPRDKPAR